MGGKKNASDNRPMGTKTTVGLDFSVIPFASGASREAFTATVQDGGCYKGYTNGTKLVLKTFKSEYYNKGLRVSNEDVEMQLKVKDLAESFNKEEGIDVEGHPCNIYVRVACLDQFQRTFRYNKREVFLKGEQFLLEQQIHGTFQKFNSNTGWSSGDDIMDAFSHWTWHKTRSMLVCDLQGVRGGPGEPLFGGGKERYYYLITDPAINSQDKQFGVSDLGWKGIQNFFYRHKCNDLCESWWHRPNGVRHFDTVRESSYDSLLGIYKPKSSGQFTTMPRFIEEEEYESSTSDSESSEYISLSPAKIFFTHDSINKRFSCGRFVCRTFEQLLYDEIDIDDIPSMIVTKQDGKYWTFTGNRRLWVFRKLHERGVIDRIDVQVTDQRVPQRRMTTRNGGVSVRVRE
eukprot:TRINITY_DN6847_c0_g2_i1.p1 TRINITY_DN6847_c0_g2~~TRINITY_DN6847_c0_g2_i1.p1  ORF type:complete len:402 (-),score=43.53 TRINITY_DN6847_c0_g2_i1:131-1336(-)